MIYVARISKNIEADIKRNWSAWQTPGLGGTIEDCKEDIADGYANGEIREFPEFPGSFGLVHHEGISCYLLNSQNENDAINETIKNKNSFDGSGYGVAAINCKVIKSIGNLHILICEDYENEN